MVIKNDKKNRVLIFGGITLLSLLLIGAAKTSRDNMTNEETRERQEMTAILESWTEQITENNQTEWKKAAITNPLLLIQISATENNSSQY